MAKTVTECFAPTDTATLQTDLVLIKARSAIELVVGQPELVYRNSADIASFGNEVRRWFVGLA